MPFRHSPGRSFPVTPPPKPIVTAISKCSLLQLTFRQGAALKRDAQSTEPARETHEPLHLAGGLGALAACGAAPATTVGGLAVLDATSTHERSFSNGRLREEREALAIRAMATQGRLDEARLRAARFHETYPKSFFWPTLEVLVNPR